MPLIGSVYRQLYGNVRLRDIIMYVSFLNEGLGCIACDKIYRKLGTGYDWAGHSSVMLAR